MGLSPSFARGGEGGEVDVGEESGGRGGGEWRVVPPRYWMASHDGLIRIFLKGYRRGQPREEEREGRRG